MRLVRLLNALAIVILAASCGQHPEQSTRLDFRGVASPGPARGPLKVLPQNPRYFTDGSGKALLLVGSHTWDNRQDIGSDPFDWKRYLTRLQRYNHNFVRLWVWEQPKGLTTGPDPAQPMATLTPEIFGRTGPGLAADGGLKFDLTKYNDAHFDRLRHRVIDARDRGIYVSVMLFNGWSIDRKGGGGDPWKYHPFNRENNVNGVDGDPNHDGSGAETHTLQIARVTQIQEAYVRKVIDTVGDLDNVLYEISNESNTDSLQWQYHFIAYIKSHEATRASRHPVGMTPRWPEGSNVDVLASMADWISTSNDGNYKEDPPATSGSKVILVDTDHLWGIGGDRSWAWKSFTRGLNIIYMDPWEARVIPVAANPDLRVTMGYILFYARRINLAVMKPSPDLASTRYCLADPGSSYLVYLPGVDDGVHVRFIARLFKIASPWITRLVDVDVTVANRPLIVEWLNPRAGEIHRTGTVQASGKVRFTPPFGGDAVLYLYRAGADGAS
jgi:hypothetical protein